MILVIGGIKGGCGKTTLATNLAVMRSMENWRVLLVDADEQKSASDWANQREMLGFPTDFVTVQLFGKAIYAQLEKMGGDYDDVIVDVGGRDTTSQRSSLAIADTYLVPFKPRSLDIWTLGGVTTIITEVSAVNPSLQSLALINQADSRGTDNNDAIDILKECPDLKCMDQKIVHRKAFGDAAARGIAVVELITQDKKATKEMIDVYEAIYATTFTQNTRT